MSGSNSKRVKVADLNIKGLLDKLFFLLQPSYMGFFIKSFFLPILSYHHDDFCHHVKHLFSEAGLGWAQRAPSECGHFSSVGSSSPEVAFCAIGKYTACMMWCHFMQKSVTHCPCVLWHHLLLLCIYFVINAGCFPIASGHNDCCNLLSAKSDTICRQKHIIVYIIFK